MDSGGEARCVTVLPLFVNGMPARGMALDGVILLRQASMYFLRKQEWNALGIRPSSESPQMEDGEEFLSLGPFQPKVEEGSLHLRVPATAYVKANLGNGEASGLDLHASGSGFFVNLDSYLQSQHSFSGRASAELNTFGKWGSVLSTFLGGGGSMSFNGRLLTTYVRDRPERRESLRIGDSVLASGAWGRALYFGGLQWGTAFETQPELVRFPLPSIRGEALLPSTAELYVNQSLRWTAQVPAGPFEIVRPPLMSGAGQFELVVRDALGRQSLQSHTYFASPRLLAKGLADYSVSLGFVRNRLGEASFSYGRPVAASHYRRGVHNRLTVEARGEASSSLFTTGLYALCSIWGPLTGSATYVVSQPFGTSMEFSMDLQQRRFSVGLQSRQSSASFRQLGLDRERRPDRKGQSLYASLFLWRRDQLALSYLEQHRFTRERYTNVSYTVHVSGGYSINATYTRVGGARRGSVLSVGLNIQLGERGFVSTALVRDADGLSMRGSLQKNLPLGQGSGYRVSAQGGRRSRADAQYTARRAEDEVEVGGGIGVGSTNVNASYRAAFGRIGRQWFRSRRIDDSFAILQVGSYEGVRVFADNQLVAVTAADGSAIVPRLLSFQVNRLSIDSSALPFDAQLGSEAMEVRPGRRRGIAIEFPVRSVTGHALRLVKADGSPVPVWAEVQVQPGGEVIRAGMEGLIYWQGGASGALLFAAKWPGGACQARWTPPARPNYSSVAEVLLCE